MSRDSKSKRKKDRKKKTKTVRHAVLALYHSAWHFMTDSRGKTKANSAFTLNRHRRGSSTLDTMTIINNDDTDNILDSDAQQPVLSMNVTGTVENASMRSPWQDEMESRTDFNSYDTKENENMISRTPFVGKIDSTKRKKTLSSGRKHANSRKTETTPMLNALINSTQRFSCAPRIKWTTVGKKKSQKYHWSGTFRNKKRTDLSRNLRDQVRSLDLSSYEDVSNEKDRLLSYNYNCDDFGKKRSANKDATFLSNEFDQLDDVWNKRNDNVGCQTCIYICGDTFDETNFKDYDVHHRNVNSLFDVNINPRQTVTDNVDDENVVDTHDIDLYMNQSPEMMSTLCSQFPSTVDDSNGEERDKPCSTKKLVDSEIKSTLRDKGVTDGAKKKSVARSRCYELWCFLSTLLKNIILFLLLPATYTICFIYVQGIDK